MVQIRQLSSELELDLSDGDREEGVSGEIRQRFRAKIDEFLPQPQVDMLRLLEKSRSTRVRHHQPTKKDQMVDVCFSDSLEKTVGFRLF